MEKKFIRVDEVAKVLNVSTTHAYKIMRQLNEGYLKAVTEYSPLE